MLKKMNVLFLCTGNSARSILGEAILRQHGGDRFNAFSAGSQPAGKVNPLTLELLQNLKYETKDLRSKSWEEFSKEDSPEIDFVFTVCGSAAEETCPVWQGTPLSAHWGIDDPAARERELLLSECKPSNKHFLRCTKGLICFSISLFIPWKGLL